MKKFNVTGLISASRWLGEYEAVSAEEAIKMCEADTGVDFYVSLCHQCADEIDIDEVYDVVAFEI